MSRASTPEPRTCVSCGRTIEWRKKWERDWEQVRYCSTPCRRHGITDTDRALEVVGRAELGVSDEPSQPGR